MVTTVYRVTGLTCGHCVSAVRQEFEAIDGVETVVVDLVAGAASVVRVTSVATIPSEAIAQALDEAGDYLLVGDGVAG